MNAANVTETPIHTVELPWMPLGEGVSARPLHFRGGERTLQLKVEPGVRIPIHRHDGHVHALGLSGRRRLGDGSVAGPGDYVFEPAGNVDSWACEGDEPCIVQITMTGRLTYLGADGGDGAWTDTPKLHRLYLQWCHDSGITPWARGAD
ncbi:MAG: anti-sigma factor [Reyranella sp.]|jgi:2,4'-dihydroxyacetophenone dioxygenase|nr:MAG: anti-sigma factor [Reyranella sp.]